MRVVLKFDNYIIYNKYKKLQTFFSIANVLNNLMAIDLILEAVTLASVSLIRSENDDPLEGNE